MARKRTKAEAKERIETIPVLPPGIGKVLPQLKVPALVGRAAKELAKLAVEIDPLDRLAEPKVTPMKRSEVIRRVVNDPEIKIDANMLPVINDDRIMMADDGALMSRLTSSPVADRASFDVRDRLELPNKKKKRKPSKYQEELGRQLKMLKKKHPRTPVIKLMSKAHKATKKALK